MSRRALAIGLCAALAATASAAPGAGKTRSASKLPAVKAAVPGALSHDGAHARVAFGVAGALRPAREVVGRREEPLTPEEDTAKQIEKLLRGPLRYGVTGLFVADARTGEALFAVNADDPLNPASNVKMISTATALELLGPTFRYPTRLLGATPDKDGAVHGDVYLLGSWDPTLTAADLDDIAKQLVEHGVHSLDGDVVIGSDTTRDGVFRASVPIAIKAGAPGQLATASAPAGFDLVALTVTAKTAAQRGKPHLTYKPTTTPDHKLALEIGGTIGAGGETAYNLATTERTADAAYALRAAMRAYGMTVTGDVKIAELDEFVARAATGGALPTELGRHESAMLSDIVAHVNKWSINWLADRVVMTAAALSRHQAPSMDLALDAMYGWLERHAHVAKADATIDTGSGLSYHTRITAHELVDVVRSAGGFADGSDPDQARAWLASLSIAGNDGTLRSRFKTPEVRGKLHGKTGTLSTVIALSGVLDVDPDRPLVFSIVTNGDAPLSAAYTRKAHEQLIGLVSSYLAKTAKHTVAAPPAAVALPPPPAPVAKPALPDDLEDAVDDPALDHETAGSAAP